MMQDEEEVFEEGDSTDEEEYELDESLDEIDATQSDPIFPFLTVRNLVDGATPEKMLPNKRGPQSLESTHMKGSAVIALRVHGHEDPYYASFFEGKSRRFEMQFQVTFKTAPRGVVYLGGEIPEKMQLGIMTKGMCKAILSVLQKLNSKLHAGFGKDIQNETEPPHIVFPLFSAATKLVVTKAGSGEQLPQLGQNISESPEDSKKRKTLGKNGPGDIEAGDTLTFSFNSMYIDLVRWKVTNLGALPDLDLSTFWDTLPLHVVMYDVDNFQQEVPFHTINCKRYYFAFSIENTYYRKRKDQLDVLYPPTDAQENVVDDEDSDLDLPPSDPSPPSSVEEMVEIVSTESRVFACVECYGQKGYTSSFAFGRSDGSFMAILGVDAFSEDCLPYEITTIVTKSKRPKKVYEWEEMRAKLDLAFSFSQPTILSQTWIPRLRRASILTATCREDLGIFKSSKSMEPGTSVVVECPVLRPLWETKWVEEWAVLISGKPNFAQILIFSGNSRVPSFDLKSSSILSVKALHDAPFALCYPGLEIACVTRVFHLGFRNEKLRDLWLENVSSRIGAPCESLVDETMIESREESYRWGSWKRLVMNNRKMSYGSGLLDFGLEEKAINSIRNGSRLREFSNLANVFDHDTSFLGQNSKLNDILPARQRLENMSAVKPWVLTSELLTCLLLMDESPSNKKLLEVADLAGQLKDLNVVAWSRLMTEEEKLCFVLNLYNCLRLHGKLLRGQPNSLLGWAKFGSQVNYAVGSGMQSMVISLAEIEHCILRKPMNAARTIIPVNYQSTHCTRLLELSRPEPRLNFAINYGSMSSTTKIIVLSTPSLVDKYLDDVARYYVQTQLVFGPGFIKLPKLLFWYGKDFDSDTSPKNLAALVLCYLERHDIPKEVSCGLDDFQIKFRSQKWKSLNEPQMLLNPS